MAKSDRLNVPDQTEKHIRAILFQKCGNSNGKTVDRKLYEPKVNMLKFLWSDNLNGENELIISYDRITVVKNPLSFHFIRLVMSCGHFQ